MNEPGTSTGAIAVTTGAQKVTGPGVLLHVECSGGTAAGTVTVYDGTSTSGIQLCNLQSAIGATTYEDWAQGVTFNTGIYVVVSGTGSTGTITFRKN